MELFVRDYLLRLGWTFLYHDVEIVGVQIDLIARDPSGLLTLIEVKTASGLAHLSTAQERRLRRVGALLAQWESVELRLALAGNKVELLPVDALTAR